MRPDHGGGEVRVLKTGCQPCHDVCEMLSEGGGEIYIQFTLSSLSSAKCLPVFSKSERAGDLPRPEKMISKYSDEL